MYCYNFKIICIKCFQNCWLKCPVKLCCLVFNVFNNNRLTKIFFIRRRGTLKRCFAIKNVTFQMVSSNRIQSIIHYSQSVDGSLCVHVLLPGPDVHHRVIAVEPGDIFSIVDTSCRVRTLLLINVNEDMALQREFSSSGFWGLGFLVVVLGSYFIMHKTLA